MKCEAELVELLTIPKMSGYASKQIIKRTIAAALEAGISVTGIRVWPDGSVAVFSGTIDQDVAEDLTFAD